MREHHQREVDALTPDYDPIPDHLREGLRQYIQHGHVPGSFLEAVITNDLFAAVGHADELSLLFLVLLVKWFYNDAPGGCCGSKDIMAAWSAHGGLEGRRT